MNIKKFLALPDDGTISAEDAQLLNKELANISALDIPDANKADVAAYLATALNLGSVELTLVPTLDALLAELQR
jgi:hypothetical protein